MGSHRAQLGCGADEVLARLERLRDAGKISRVGPVFAPNRIGASTLAAMAVPVGELPRVAAIVSAFAGVNHNYRREHRYNLWFVASSTDEATLARLLGRMGAATGCPPDRPAAGRGVPHRPGLRPRQRPPHPPRG